jgi:TPR repeat protein
MKKYYLICIEKGCLKSMYSLGVYYESFREKDYEEMKKYFLMGSENGCPRCMFRLAQYYEIIEQNFEAMKKYYLMSINNGMILSMYHLKNYYFYKEKNKLKFYNLLYNLEIKSDIIVNTMNELSLNDLTINKYQNKINLNKNNIKECIICYETLSHISFNCKHEICINCYCCIDKCFYRCC